MRDTVRTAEFKSRLRRILRDSPRSASEIRIVYAPRKYIDAAHEYLRRELEKEKAEDSKTSKSE